MGRSTRSLPEAGFARVVENLESHGNLKFQNPGLENLENMCWSLKVLEIILFLGQRISFFSISSLTFSSFLWATNGREQYCKIVPVVNPKT